MHRVPDLSVYKSVRTVSLSARAGENSTSCCTGSCARTCCHTFLSYRKLGSCPMAFSRTTCHLNVRSKRRGRCSRWQSPDHVKARTRVVQGIAANNAQMPPLHSRNESNILAWVDSSPLSSRTYSVAAHLRGTDSRVLMVPSCSRTHHQYTGHASYAVPLVSGKSFFQQHPCSKQS